MYICFFSLFLLSPFVSFGDEFNPFIYYQRRSEYARESFTRLLYTTTSPSLHSLHPHPGLIDFRRRRLSGYQLPSGTRIPVSYPRRTDYIDVPTPARGVRMYTTSRRPANEETSNVEGLPRMVTHALGYFSFQNSDVVLIQIQPRPSSPSSSPG